MSLFKKKSKTSPPSSSRNNNNNNNPHPPPLTPPLHDETPISSISTMRASQSAASSISTGTGAGTSKGLPSTLSSTGSSTRSRKPSLKRIFSTKKSKEELVPGGTSPDGSVGKAGGGGGGLSGWIGKRRSRDLMGYKGAGFAGAAAVEEGTGGREREREREGSGASGGSAGGMMLSEEEQEQEQGERVQLRARVVDWANPSSFVSPPPHHQPFPTSMPSSSPPPPPKVEASAPPGGGPSTPPSSLHSRRRQTSLSSISTSPSSAKDQPADRMRKASLLGLFSGAKKDGSGGSVGSRASVEVDRSTVEAESLGTTSTTTNTTTGGSGGVGGGSERSRSRSPAGMGEDRRKGLHTPSPSPAASASSLLPAIPTPAPHGTTDFFPPPSTPTSTFIHHQPSSPQPLPPVVSTSYGADELASPTSVDLPLAPQPDFGTTVTTPSTSSLRATSPNPPASASEALLQTLVLSSAKTPKVQVKLRKKDSLGSNSPVGRVRRKKVPGAGEGGEQEARSSQESSRRGNMDVARGESSPTKKTEGGAAVAGGDEVASASPLPSSTSQLELPLPSSPSSAPIEDTTHPKDFVVVVEEEPTEPTSIEAHNGSSSTSPRPSPPPSVPPTPAPTEASETFTTYVAGSLHSPTPKHTQLDESLHPAPLTFFESNPPTTDPTSSPKPTSTTLLAHQAPITFRFPNPLHPFLFLLSIPLAPRLVPGFVKDWVRRERIVSDLDLGRVEEGGKRVVRGAGTVVKWGVGWWVIVPWRVGRWVVGR